jgi:hypothetical protein
MHLVEIGVREQRYQAGNSVCSAVKARSRCSSRAPALLERVDTCAHRGRELFRENSSSSSWPRASNHIEHYAKFTPVLLRPIADTCQWVLERWTKRCVLSLAEK